MIICICIIIASILLIIIAVYQSVVAAPRRKALARHHELSWNLTNKGADTNSLKTAKKCLHVLSNSCEAIKGHANASARFCYEDDIEEIRQNAEDMAVELRQCAPEYQRKMKLRSLMMQKIANHETVQRSHLLKTAFDGFTAEEINACYKGLAKEHAVIEYKQGAVYFVVLSDAAAKKYSPKRKANQNPAKEKPRPARAAGKAESEESMIASRTVLLYRELIRHFDEEGIEYVDKTVNGGSLYFFSEAAADDLKKKDYPVLFAEKGTKGTGHRPAWYIKL